MNSLTELKDYLKERGVEIQLFDGKSIHTRLYGEIVLLPEGFYSMTERKLFDTIKQLKEFFK